MTRRIQPAAAGRTLTLAKRCALETWWRSGWPRAEKYDQGYAAGFAQCAKQISNMLQRRGHDAAALLVTDEEHQRIHTTGVTK